MSADAVRAGLLAARVIAVVRDPDPATAERIAEAAIAAGVRAVEITRTVAGADALLAALRRRHADEVLLGVGTVLEPSEVASAVAAGATYVVSPHLDLAVVEAARSAGALPVPGVLTPGEAATARRAGLDLVKLFPAASVGPSHLAALRSVFPEVEIVPTGGVDAGTAGAWFRAGAAAVGVSGALNAAHTRTGPDGVTELCRALLAASGPDAGPG